MELIGKPSIHPLLFYTGKAAGYATWALFALKFLRLVHLPGNPFPWLAWLSCAVFLAGLAAATASLVDLGKDTRRGLPTGQTALRSGGIYRLSIVLFILALRGLGTARTSACFATAPFIGAGLSMAIFRQAPGRAFMLALPLAAAGVWLLFGERHEHQHVHGVLEHSHRHTHDDGHHGHGHPEGEAAAVHSHRHIHPELVHAHPHAPDIHHRHGHYQDGRTTKAIPKP